MENSKVKWTFKDFKTDLDSLNPQVKEKAIEIAKGLQNQGNWTEKEAIEEGTKRAEEWFYDLEG